MTTEFTPLPSLIGGIMIGLSAVALMAANGRIAGATGILSGAFFAADKLWRVFFLAGVLAAPFIMSAFGVPLQIDVPVSAALLVVGGVFVGVGVTLGSGCTTGHGVCGMARLSVRSIAATATFFIACTATVFIIRHVIGGL